MAIAVDPLGCPEAHNFLIGSVFVKMGSGHEGSLEADGFSALYDGSAPGCNGSSVTFTILFDGNTAGNTPSYDRLPRVLALTKIPSVAEGNDTRLAVIRVGGSMLTGATPIGSLFGFLFDDLETPHSWGIQNVPCQLFQRIDNNFPHTSPQVETVIPSGKTGWLKFFTPPPVDGGLLGSVFNRNSNLGSAPNAFIGGHNLHKLTLTATNSITLPVFPPNCI
jgi:hypothetical protein